MVFRFLTLQRQGREVGDSLNQQTFQRRGLSRIASKNLQASQEKVVERKNRAGRKNFQADLQGAASHRTEVIFVRVWERDDRDHVADTNINHHAEFVQDARQRGAERNQLEDLVLSDDRATAVIGTISTKPEVAGRPLGAWLVSHDGHPIRFMRRAIPRGGYW